MFKNPPSNAGNTGSIPGPGTKIPLAEGKLSQCSATRESHALQPRAHVLQWRPSAAKKQKQNKTMFVDFKVAKRPDLNFSYHRKEMIIMWYDRGIS